jgi:hypothetical protein
VVAEVGINDAAIIKCKNLTYGYLTTDPRSKFHTVSSFLITNYELQISMRVDRSISLTEKLLI